MRLLWRKITASVDGDNKDDKDKKKSLAYNSIGSNFYIHYLNPARHPPVNPALVQLALDNLPKPP